MCVSWGKVKKQKLLKETLYTVA